MAASVWAAARLVHVAPTLAVTALSAALAGILLGQSGRGLDAAWAWTVVAVLGSQVFVGATNDLVDRSRDTAAARVTKPLVDGSLEPAAAVWVASIGLAVQLAASLRLGTPVLLFGLVAIGSALAYNLWLSRTPLSVLPYLVSFGVLPLWIATGVGVPLERVALAPMLVAPFAAAAHLANALRDFDADAALGSRNLAQVLGHARAFIVAWGMALGVGLAVGAALLLGGPIHPIGLVLGLAGLLAVAQGVRGADALWLGMLVAAVCWTAAWALSTG
ncbi:MAG TPA: UbiA family prenyltransferase [Candidatus Limnocylindria bacterium]|nr:UbiA family prenyltransferase [Candidatus Limnocylindria bacterium]